MKKFNLQQIAIGLAISATAFSAAANPPQNQPQGQDHSQNALQAKISELEAQNAALKQTLQKYEANKTVELANLKRFDDLDYIGWTGKNIPVFEAIHSPNVHVEGIMTANNLAKHSADAQGAMANLKNGDGVKSHPIRLADGDWTAVVGETQSTITDATTGATRIARGTMLTLARWNNGQIAEEYLYSLNGDFSTSWMNKYIATNVQPTQPTVASPLTSQNANQNVNQNPNQRPQTGMGNQRPPFQRH